ncbi:MAG: capsular biosynthesis protein, partial [Cetobacterium sp.]
MPLTEKKIKNKEHTYSSIEDFNFIFCEISKKFRKIDIKQEDLYKISKIKKELEEELGVSAIKILEQKSIIKILKKFKSEYDYYKRFLKKRQCEQIYLVCSYGREALIAAAQDLNIEVIEIQHGVINKYHLGYNFPNSDKVPYFPNKILLFGEYWYENTKLPLKKDQVQIVGYSYMNQQINKYRGKILEKKDQILFISQPASGIEISEKAVEFAKLNPNYNVIVRLHPKEWDNWRNDYKILYENRDLDNLKISDSNNKDLYEYLFESRYIFGIYSTVIYEALYLEKKIG